MLDYSLSMRANPSDPEQPKRAYANTQVKEVLNVDAFANHIVSHGCVYSKGDIVGIITMIIACIREQMLAGNAVQLGELGKFAPHIHSFGAKDMESFNPATNVKRVSVKWSAGEDLKGLEKVAKYNRVLTKKEEAAAKKKVYVEGETLVTE